MNAIRTYFCLVLLLSSLCLSNTVFAVVHTAVSCENKGGQTDIQDAVNLASDGDIVLVPAGNCTITTQVAVTNKKIAIIGAGIDTTTLTANITSGTRPGVFKVTTKPARIKGFTFNGTAPTYGAHVVFEGTGDETALFRIDNCKFTVNSGYAILVWGLSYGLIDNNTFITTVDHSFIDLYSDNRTSWGRASSLGTNKAVYIEDCTFTNSAVSGNYRTVTTDAGVRFVFRYNTVTNQALDAHGYCGNGLAGTMSFEIYNNTWLVTSGTSMFRWIFLRSGTGVVYNNAMTNNGTISRHIDMTEYRLAGVDSCTGAAKTCCTSYPCLDQIGRGTDQALDPAYFWNNTVNEVAAVVSVNPVIDSAWKVSTVYSQDYYVVPIVSNGYYYSATTGGTSSSSEPSWPTTIGQTVGDNSITWINMCQILNISSVIQINRDYFVDVAKPNYTPYVYPHPLAVTPQPPANLKISSR